MNRKYRLAAFALCVWTAGAHGLSAEGNVGEIAFSVYAPDWTWQGRDANVMAVLENTSDEEITCRFSLIIPGEFAEQFGRNGARSSEDAVPIESSVSIPAGETRRLALTGLTALHGYPLQTYPLEISVRSERAESTIPYPLQTIRGQAVSEGKAIALGVPIGLALLFSAGFALVLRSTAAADAWKKPGPGAEEPTNPEPWIATEPK